MSNPAFDLFLLATQLSQARSRTIAISLFIEGMNNLFPDLHIQWSGTEAADSQRQVAVCTRHATFGWVGYTSAGELDESTAALIHNACQMLGLILEKIDQAQRLVEQNQALETLVAERAQMNETLEMRVAQRTADLEAANQALSEARRQALSTMEDAIEAGRQAEETAATLRREIAERKQAESELKRIEWMLTPHANPSSGRTIPDGILDNGYGDLSVLNTNGRIAGAIEQHVLQGFVSDFLDLLGTSSAIFEANGDYALGIFSSRWCRMLDGASRELCQTDDNRDALASGRWLCHDSCWACSSAAMATGTPVDMACAGGIRLYAVPIFSHNEVIGAINFGYGDPPEERPQLQRLAQEYGIDEETLVQASAVCESRPPFIIEMAKRRLQVAARLIGSLVDRKRAEEALGSNEEKYRTLVDNAGEAICVAQEGRLRFVNPHAVDMTGYAVEELTSQPFIHFVHPDDRDMVMNNYTRRIEGDLASSEYDFRIVQKSGAVRWVHIKVAIITWEEQPATLNFLLDFTERKQAEDQVAESHNLLTNLACLVPGVVYQYRLWPDGRSAFPFASPGMLDIYELTPEEVQEDATPVFGRLHPDDRQHVVDAILDSARSLKAFYCEFRVILPRQGLRWRWSQAQPERTEDGGTLWHGIISDITERKQAEEQLQHSHDLMRYIIEHTQSAVAVHDCDLRYVYVSQRYLDEYGVKEKNIIGRHHYDVFPDLPQKWRDVHQRALRGEVCRADNDSYEREDGTVEWTRWECRPWYSADGVIGGIIVYTEVITRHIQAQQALRESEEKHRRLFETMAQGVVYHAADGAIIAANPAAERILGLSLDQMRGKTTMDPRWKMIREDGAPVAGADHPSMVALRTGRPVGPVVRGVYRPETDDYVWLSIIATPLKQPGETAPNQVYATFEDITARRQAEEEYGALFQQMLDGFAVHEMLCDPSGAPVDYRFLAVNPAFERMTGLQADAIVGRTVMEILPGTEPYWIETYGRVALTGEPAFFENYHADVGKHFEVTAFRPAPHQFACIFQDTTERKQAEEALRKERALLKSIVDHIPVMITRYDPAANMMYLNREFEKIIGWTTEEIQSINLLEQVYPDPAYRLQVMDYMLQATVEWREFAVRAKSGDIIFSEWSNIRLDDGTQLGIGIDIRKSKAAEEALRKSEAFLRDVAANIPGAVYRFVQQPDGTFHIPFMSEGAEDLFGRPLQELQDASLLFSDLHPDDVADMWASIAESARAMLPWEYEFRILHSDGAWKWLRGMSNPSALPDGAICWNGVMLDITERKQVESEREAAIRVLQILHASTDLPELMQSLLRFLQEQSDCEAVGIRLRLKDDYPYYVTSGFPDAFVEAETHLCVDNMNGQLERDDIGNPILECMCGNIIHGRFDPSLPFFTKFGSFITNSTSELLASTSEEDRQARTRNRCNAEGYESVLLVPLRTGGRTFGLLQFNDHRKGHFSPQFVAQTESVAAHVVMALAQRAAEAALRESQDRLASIFRVAPTGIGVVRDRVFMEVNARITEMTGYTAEELVGQSARILYPSQEEYEYVGAEKYRQIQEHGTGTVETRWRHKDGTDRDVFLSSTPLDPQDLSKGVTFTAMDITERKGTEEALRLFKTIFDTANFGAVIADCNGVLIYCNASFATSHGHDPEDLVGRPIAILHSDEQMGQVDTLLERIRREGGFNAQEVWHRHKNGGVFPMLMSATLVSSGSDTARYLAATAMDMTERKRLEDQLTQAQKMESVGRLAGGVAHDFNNMLGVIIGHAEMALLQLEPSHAINDDLREVLKAAERSADLTRQLLAFARKQTVAPKVLDLNATVEGMLKMLRRLIGEDIDLAWRPAGDLWPIKMDPSQIDQILANLSVNARDAIAGVGKVTIETDNRVFDEASCTRDSRYQPGEYVHLAVSDNGCGMAPETLEHLFEPFFTTKSVGKGTGLGLATVYGIVKQNEGFINVYSEPGQGTTFSIFLPRHVGKRAGAQTASADGPPLRGSETILLVEDAPAILKMATRMLERQGYRVLAAATPGEALRLAERHGGDIHLVLTDVVMPEMNGRDLVSNLLDLYPNLKRLFMSGYTADVIAHHGVLDPGVHFIHKPFTMKDLAAKLREALEKE